MENRALTILEAAWSFLKHVFSHDTGRMPLSWVAYGYVTDKDGVMFRPEFLALPDSEKHGICNGVGASRGVSRIAPDTVFGMSIRDIADQHDYDYFIGGDTEDRAVADLVFYNNMYRRFLCGSILLFPLRLHRAKLYYLALRKYGFKHFCYKVRPYV